MSDIRVYEIGVTKEYSGANPVWTKAEVFVITDSTAAFSMPVLGSTKYAVRYRKQDVFGNYSAWSTHTEHTTLAGSDSLTASAATQASTVLNATATITIDASGLTITDGALTLKDAFGASVLTASGFGGSWADFVATGLYNGAFKAGVAGVVGVGRLVGLPYWTSSNQAGSPVLTFLNPGAKVTFAAIGNVKKLVSDRVPILASDALHVFVDYSYTRVAGSLELTLEVITYDSTGVQVDTTGELSVSSGASPISLSRRVYESNRMAASGAYSVEFVLRAKETVAHNAGNDITVYGVAMIRHGTKFADIYFDHLVGNVSIVVPTVSATDITASNSSTLGTASATSLAVTNAIQHGLISGGAGATTEGSEKWDDTQRALVIGDSVRAKVVTPVGWAPRGLPEGWGPFAAYATSAALTAVVASNGGAKAVPIYVIAPMTLSAYRYRNLDVASARSVEFSLYYSKLNNSGTITRVTGSAATDSFTPAAASNRAIALTGGDIHLPAGVYWLVIRNTSATQTFGLATLAADASALNIAMSMGKSIAALGATIDIITSWVGSTQVCDVVLIGEKPDGSSNW